MLNYPHNWLHLNLNFTGSVNVGKWLEFWSITCHSLLMWRNKVEHCTGFESPLQPWKQVINYAMWYMAASYVNHEDVNVKQQIKVIVGLYPCHARLKSTQMERVKVACERSVVVWLEGMQESGCVAFLNFWANVVHMLQCCEVFWRVWGWPGNTDLARWRYMWIPKWLWRT